MEGSFSSDPTFMPRVHHHCGAVGRAFENEQTALQLWPNVTCASKVGEESEKIIVKFKGFLRNVEETNPVDLVATIVVYAPSGS
jgi:hypothetical protein